MYEYKAELDRVVDGDTVDLIVDLGFNVRVKERFRLALINAPESRTKDLEEKARGIAATEYLSEIFERHEFCKIRTDRDKKGKFGRWIAQIYVSHDEEPDRVNGWLEVNSMMVSAGHAEFVDYG